MSQNELGRWSVSARINQADNLAVRIDLDGQPHAELILQEGGIVDLVTKGRREKDLGIQGWDAPGTSVAGGRRFRFDPE